MNVCVYGKSYWIFCLLIVILMALLSVTLVGSVMHIVHAVQSYQSHGHLPRTGGLPPVASVAAVLALCIISSLGCVFLLYLIRLHGYQILFTEVTTNTHMSTLRVFHRRYHDEIVYKRIVDIIGDYLPWHHLEPTESKLRTIMQWERNLAWSQHVTMMLKRKQHLVMHRNSTMQTVGRALDRTLTSTTSVLEEWDLGEDAEFMDWSIRDSQSLLSPNSTSSTNSLLPSYDTLDYPLADSAGNTVPLLESI